MVAEITYINFERYNRYDNTLGEYRFGYVEKSGSTGDALTSSHIPVTLAIDKVITEYILPQKMWTEAMYKGVKYALISTLPPIVQAAISGVSKEIAVQTVVDYFAGNVAKATAVQTVVDYFAGTPAPTAPVIAPTKPIKLSNMNVIIIVTLIILIFIIFVR